MGRELLEQNDTAAELVEMGERVSGFPLRQLCLEGPFEQLTRVLYLQPAITVVNLMCWHYLQDLLADFVPACFAGHSLGEYSALYAAGAVTARETMALVTRRGELMEREGSNNPGGMCAILGLPSGKVDELAESCDGPGTVVVANYNTPMQAVVSGDKEGLDRFCALCREEGAKTVPLKVSVANHSPLVAGAVADFRSFLEEVAFQLPKVPVLFNVTAKEVTTVEEIRQTMARQIASPVRWLNIIETMLADGVEVFIELGPKKVLTGMMKKIVPRGSAVVCINADTPESIERAAEVIRG
ncbi:MAG: malonyl CoA-acyl carrier protein transacylase [Desulfobulbus propionicus]|nr:MAG: malonyl CoA-acyl carrier protein transacylase [Desulfobulbus propionicus]